MHGDDDGEYEGGDGDGEDLDDYLRDMLAGGGSGDDDDEEGAGAGDDDDGGGSGSGVDLTDLLMAAGQVGDDTADAGGAGAACPTLPATSSNAFEPPFLELNGMDPTTGSVQTAGQFIYLFVTT